VVGEDTGPRGKGLSMMGNDQSRQQSLGAKLFGGNRMFIDTREAYILTTKYFKDFKL